MPVEDHAVHPSTRVGKDFRYGCWNRSDKFKEGYWAPQRRFFPDGRFEMKVTFIPFKMSHNCHHDRIDYAMGKADTACEGCRHYGTK